MFTNFMNIEGIVKIILCIATNGVQESKTNLSNFREAKHLNEHALIIK